MKDYKVRLLHKQLHKTNTYMFRKKFPFTLLCVG